MKSFKHHKPHNQIRIDHLLGINVQPDNTCPLIDALIYSGSYRSKVYRVEIDNDPSHLTLDTSQLINRIQDLETWVNDVVDLYHEVIDKVTDSDELIELTDYHDEIVACVKDNKDYEIKDMEKDINSLIDDWQEYHDDYNKAQNQLETAQSELSKAEYNYSLLDESDEDYEEEESNLKHELDNAQDNFNSVETEISKIKDNFNFDIDHKFDNITVKFSELLEKVRANNDKMRTACNYLKSGLLPHLKDDYNLTQPIEYLRNLESGLDTEISLGLLDINYYNRSLAKITNFLSNEDILTDVQVTLINKVRDINCLTDILQSVGYTKIRYYDNYETYRKHPELYIEVNSKVQNKLSKNNQLSI